MQWIIFHWCDTMKGYNSLIETQLKNKMFMKEVKHSWLVRRTVAEEYTNWVLGLNSKSSYLFYLSPMFSYWHYCWTRLMILQTSIIVKLFCINVINDVNMFSFSLSIYPPMFLSIHLSILSLYSTFSRGILHFVSFLCLPQLSVCVWCGFFLYMKIKWVVKFTESTRNKPSF